MEWLVIIQLVMRGSSKSLNKLGKIWKGGAEVEEAKDRKILNKIKEEETQSKEENGKRSNLIENI